MITPRDYQIDVVNRLRAKVAAGARCPILQGATGSGKCLGAGTPVMLYDGTELPVECVVPGDLLMGPDSQPRRVLSVCSGEDDLYRVVPTKGEPYVVNAAHILSLKMTPARAGQRHAVVNVNVLDYLGRCATFKHRAKGWRAAINWPARAVALDPYFLGLWLGDGSAANTAISKPDAEVEQFVREFAAARGLGFSERRQPGKCPAWAVVKDGGYRNPVRRELAFLGVTRRRHIPHQYKCNSRGVRLAVLAGLLDTDGHYSNGGYDYVSKDRELADDVAFVCRSLGLAAYVSPCEKSCQGGFVGLYHRVSISGDCSMIPTRIPRKQAADRRQIKDVTVTGISVEPVGRGRYYGFEIDGNRLFLLGDFTVTHNTTCSSMLVKSAVDKGKRVLFLAHRRRLVEQKAARLDQFGVPYGLLMAGERRNNAPVQVASRDTLFSRAVRNQWVGFPPADLVVIDECHNSPEQYRTLRSQYPRAVIVGLTATPTRGDGSGLGGYFDALVCTVPVSRLVAEGHLVPVDCYAPQRAAGGGKRQLCGDVVYHWRKYGAGRPTVLFAATVDASKAAVNAFNAAGISAVHIDAHTPDKDRDAAIAGLESGKVQVVGNCSVWGEGVDVPCLSCCVLLRLASSYVTFAQAVGRVMRPFPGKDRAVLIDHSGAVFEHGFPDEDVQWSLDESETVDQRVQKDKAEGKRKEPICCPRCAYLFSGSVQCPACGYALFHQPKAAAKKDALLFPVAKDEEAALTREDAERYWKRCLAMAAARGGKVAQAFAMFRSKYPDTGTRGFRHDPQPGEMRRPVVEVFPGFSRGAKS